ncbi:Argininosuccinate lyase [Delftia tsuruhatensis]|uniref:tripartite tricarboxylate transporter substrate-binding protein n=1 Tax=Delftia tsuruhatensis TaxID=180282 RepID=UPI001E70E9B0|nr:tripartite tricarboxylate transporter substrate-binding protein [Delftia tsuruhatensis]CAB5686332.1 Argininosuccinate lyase [Delftia tsuruhatensis]CAC9690391.1 Argininosuccinate lyase [Delftia tsuruhatensis]
MTVTRLHRLIAAALLATVAGHMHAQSHAPARIVVGFPAGGSADTVARLIADKLRDEWKRPVLVDNRPGAGGQVAAALLKAQPHDGSVVMLAPDGLVTTNPFVFRRLPYAPGDLLPVSVVAEFPFALATAAGSGARDLPSYAAWSRQHPGKASFGSPAAGSPPHFTGTMIGRDIGVPLMHVPYQGSAPLMTAIMSGEIAGGIATLTDMIEFHRAGKLRVLGISSAARASVLPDVPTFAEQGYRQLVVTGRYLVFAPPGTPAHAVQNWNAALTKALGQADLRQRLAALGIEARTGSPQEAAALLQEAARLWEPAIRASGFVAD